MAHFAKVQNGIVTQVIVAEPEFFQTFVDTSPGEWIQTSYNTRGGVHYKPDTNEPSDDQSKALRKNYAGTGFTYDKTRDAFIPPKPYVLPETILKTTRTMHVPVEELKAGIEVSDSPIKGTNPYVLLPRSAGLFTIVQTPSMAVCGKLMTGVNISTP